MKFLHHLLKSYQYDSWLEFGQSLAPTTKYNLTSWCSGCSMFLVSLDQLIRLIFGLDGMAFVAFVLILVTELVTGIWASKVRKEIFESAKLRRFGFRLFPYLVLIGASSLMAENFRARDKFLAMVAFDWLHIFLVIQITFENFVSILENVSVIEGKEKTHLITKLKDRIKTII